ncbi:MAG: acyl-CoA desaturase [Parachlamydiaceae bacterium]|nr:acyl-CoA desaturase [Parachlamydiaceae bacterium]
MKSKKIRFTTGNGEQFLTVVRQRVDQYLNQQGVHRYATWTTHTKVILHIALGLFLYFSIIWQLFSPWILFPMSMLLGMVSGFIGVNLCHDCLHGSYSANPRVNLYLGYTYDFVGLSSLVWKMTHNAGHHIYTNIPGLDPDIDKPFLLRLTPDDKHYWFHRWQSVYIWLLYSLVGINWIFYSDYATIVREINKISRRDLLIFFAFKAINFLIFLAIPMYVMTLPWWQILLGYLGYQVAGGFAVALVFQLAHMVENLEFPAPSKEGTIDRPWGEHEMYTTANFGTKNIFLTYFLGGLNFQIEHHLMPYVSHVHYPSIAPIVKKTAAEFNLPYRESPSMLAAIASHWRLLRELGRGTKIKN